MVKTKTEQAILDALEPAAAERGIDIVDVEVVGATKAPCARVRIERLDGAAITLDEVSAQTKWISEILDELDPISSSYTLEVSSPGLARPLRRPQDFERFTGEECEIKTTATQGRRSFTGTIAGCTDEAVTIEADGERIAIPFDEIKKSTLKPAYDFKGSKEEK